MPDEFFFKVEENQNINEFTKFDAEKYDTLENLTFRKEEFTAPEIYDEKHTSPKSHEKDDTDFKDAKRLNRLSSVNQGVSRVISTIGTATIGIASAFVIMSALLFTPPTIEITNLEYGSNYATYEVSLDDCNKDTTYKITISDDENIISDEAANAGINKAIVYDLTPDTEYTISLIGLSTDKQETIYYSQLFTTRDATYVDALLSFDYTFNGETFDITYEAFASDANADNQYLFAVFYPFENSDPEIDNPDEQFYYEFIYEDRFPLTNTFKGQFEIYSPGNYELGVFQIITSGEDQTFKLIKQVSMEVNMPDGIYLYNEYSFYEYENKVYISGEIFGNTLENHHYQINIIKTKADKTTITTHQQIELDYNYFYIYIEFDSSITTISYQIVIVEDNSVDLSTYTTEIFSSSTLDVNLEPTI